MSQLTLTLNGRRDQQSLQRIYQTTEPFFLPGTGENGKTALYLIHGFTGSPSEFRRLGYFLNDKGFTVKAICLPGHGTKPEDMIRTGYKDWWRGVHMGYEELRQEGFERIVPIGHSMGGLLSFMLAMKEDVVGVISLSTPIHLGSRKAALAYLLQHFVKFVAKRRPPGVEHIVQEALAYDKTPVSCVVSFRKLLFRMKKELHQLQVPLFIAQGERDRTSLPRSAAYIYNKAASAIKEMKLYPNSSHSLLLDEDKDEVYTDIFQFLDKLPK